MNRKVLRRIIWKVSDCSKENFMLKAFGAEICSPSFDVKFGDIDTKWCFLFYPNGNKDESKSNISLFLKLIESSSKSSSKSFKVVFEMSIESKNIEGDSRLTADAKRGENFTNWGWPKFISHEELFDPVNGFVAVDGSITIICELTLSKPKSNSALSVVKPAVFKDLFEDDDLADFEVKMSDGKVLNAHKVILSLQSKVFKAMLKKDTKEAQEGVVTIPDFDSKTMKEALRFMYTNEVKNLKELDRDLVFAAEKYELDELKEICIKSIIKGLTTENVLEALVISERLSDAEEMFEECAEFIINHHKIVNSQKDQWKEVPFDCMMKFNEKMMKVIEKSVTIELVETDKVTA